LVSVLWISREFEEHQPDAEDHKSLGTRPEGSGRSNVFRGAARSFGARMRRKPGREGNPGEDKATVLNEETDQHAAGRYEGEKKALSRSTPARGGACWGTAGKKGLPQRGNLKVEPGLIKRRHEPRTKRTLLGKQRASSGPVRSGSGQQRLRSCEEKIW